MHPRRQGIRRQELNEIERMQREMDEAIKAEAYEKAAQLRDAIRAMNLKK